MEKLHSWIVFIDKKIIMGFEALAHVIQKMFGKDNFWLMWLCFYSRLCLMAYEYAISEKKTYSPFAFVFVSLLQFFIFGLLKHLEMQGRMSVSSSRFAFRNFLENWYILRILRMSQMIFLIGDLLHRQPPLVIIISGVSVSMYYFVSCTPLPPGQSKISQFISYLKGLFSPTPALAGAPS